ncbi:DUF6042 family protein [Tepidibacter hydrothermalis]|uniref:DUF6042 family protein n=1 Tax=Tepidibacter hydrothermalis TaxID=3036126 RepID=A0ABY8EC58_9FIRM|nr:DUF6042 family protein [Tepidibacter hydrothermalis]WFD10520.1 DUF6042 family protein [Tepidibacter hydrothermalis]
MDNRVKINVPEELQEYMWFRYMPLSTYKTYLVVGATNSQQLKGLEATQNILNTNLEGGQEEHPQVIEDKKNILNKLGFEYPKTRQDDLDLLLKYKLVDLKKDEDGIMYYEYTKPVPKPEDVLNLDDGEKQILQNIKFEVKHQEDLNQILTLLINSNGNILTTLDHIHTMTKVNHADIKTVLEYLVNEGSIKVKTDKDVKDLRKSDKVYVSIIKEVFEKKRFVIS